MIPTLAFAEDVLLAEAEEARQLASQFGHEASVRDLLCYARALEAQVQHGHKLREFIHHEKSVVGPQKRT